MTKFDDRNRGSIWKNEKKETDKHPDFTGSQNVVCAGCGQSHDYWVSAWKRKEGAAERAPALSFSVKLKDSKPQSVGAAPKTASRTNKDDMDGDFIPF